MGSKIDHAAVEATTRKRPLESSSDLVEVIPKQPRVDTDTTDTTDTDAYRFKEFSALLQRIEANRQDPAAKCVQAGKADDAKAVASQASWWLSFEWEDFSPRGNRTGDVGSEAGDQKLKGREQERVSLEASLTGEDRSLDLNLPLGLISL